MQNDPPNPLRVPDRKSAYQKPHDPDNLRLKALRERSDKKRKAQVEKRLHQAGTIVYATIFALTCVLAYWLYTLGYFDAYLN